MTSRPLEEPRANALVLMLDVDLDAGVCHACLSFVSLALGRSSVARAIVRRLAEELSRRSRTEMRLETLARNRLRLAPPELN